MQYPNNLHVTELLPPHDIDLLRCPSQAMVVGSGKPFFPEGHPFRRGFELEAASLPAFVGAAVGASLHPAIFGPVAESARRKEGGLARHFLDLAGTVALIAVARDNPITEAELVNTEERHLRAMSHLAPETATALRTAVHHTLVHTGLQAHTRVLEFDRSDQNKYVAGAADMLAPLFSVPNPARTAGDLADAFDATANAIVSAHLTTPGTDERVRAVQAMLDRPLALPNDRGRIAMGQLLDPALLTYGQNPRQDWYGSLIGKAIERPLDVPAAEAYFSAVNQAVFDYPGTGLTPAAQVAHSGNA